MKKLVNISGLIHQYDYSMDEGTAIPIGLFLLVLWLGYRAFFSSIKRNLGSGESI